MSASKTPKGSLDAKEWESQETAEIYRSRQSTREEMYKAITERMLQVANVRNGSRVLDVAAGTGGQTIMAARLVGPSGYVLAVDTSPTMLKAAAEEARLAGLMHVETRVMDTHNLDVSANSFDAVICRMALMLLANPVTALLEMRRAVKPGGRVTAVVFSTADKNPYFGVPLRLLSQRGLKVQPLFSLGKPAMLEETFRASGLRNIAIHEFGICNTFSSITEVISRMAEAIVVRTPMASLSDAERQQFWAEVQREMGRYEHGGPCEIPGERLLGVGEK